NELPFGVETRLTPVDKRRPLTHGRATQVPRFHKLRMCWKQKELRRGRRKSSRHKTALCPGRWDFSAHQGKTPCDRDRRSASAKFRASRSEDPRLAVDSERATSHPCKRAVGGECSGFEGASKRRLRVRHVDRQGLA